MSASNPSRQSGDAAAKPRNPIEKLLVRGFIVVMLAVVAVEAGCWWQHNQALSALNAKLDAVEKEPNAPAVTETVVKSLLGSRQPIQSEELDPKTAPHGAGRVDVYSWFTLSPYNKREIKIYYTKQLAGDKDPPEVLSIEGSNPESADSAGPSPAVAATGPQDAVDDNAEEEASAPSGADSAAASALVGTTAGQIRDDNGLKLKLVWCPPGTFKMGSPESEADRLPNEAQVDVTLTKGFWLGQTEVTQEQWQSVMQTTPWKDQKNSKEGANYAATYMNWPLANEFCKKLTAQERAAGRLPSGWLYSLPTEAQWEYACRAGTATRFSFGDDTSSMGDYAWWGGNTESEPYPNLVGVKAPNAWGLHDLHGNAWEWCRDWYDDKLAGGSDPTGPAKATTKALRGGNWGSAPRACRSAGRSGMSPTFQAPQVGLRIALRPSLAKGKATDGK